MATGLTCWINDCRYSTTTQVPYDTELQYKSLLLQLHVEAAHMCPATHGESDDDLIDTDRLAAKTSVAWILLVWQSGNLNLPRKDAGREVSCANQHRMIQRRSTSCSAGSYRYKSCKITQNLLTFLLPRHAANHHLFLG